MNALVIYDSLFGNTRLVAEAVAKEIGGKAISVKDFSVDMLSDLSILVVGCPIHAWNPSQPTSRFLASLPADSLQGMRVAAFDTRIRSFLSGDASGKVLKRLINLGGKSAAHPEKFIVTGREGPLAVGEMDRAKNWAREMAEGIDLL